MKIILSATTSWNLFNSRMDLARTLKKHGNEVVFISPRDEFTQYLLSENFRWVHFPLEPRGKNIFKELISILFLISFYRREKPDLVNHFTPKGVIYGSLAAKLAGVKRVFNTITGLGYVFSDEANKLIQTIVMLLYPIALANTYTIFQNPDDQKLFYHKKIVNPRQSILIQSSGVDTEKFQFVPQAEGKPVVLLSSRFVEEKGIRYFVEASRILKARKMDVVFVLVGKPENNQPTSIPLEEIEQWISSGLVEWWGWHDDMEEIYPKAHIVCLPTYYKEGVPKVLIEAAACGRSLIATDVPGCRAIVLDHENGLLVPPRNANTLAQAIEKLALDPELRKRMGKRSREIAVSKFSVEKIISEYIKVYQI